MSKDIIVIGSSTGGPKVLNEMFSELPALNASIIIVQHVPPKFDKAIAERLNELSSMAVKVAEHGEAIKNGTAYMAPSRKHLKLTHNSRIMISEDEKVNGCCPSVDVAMMSLVRQSSGKLVGIILTGLGMDGASGIGHIKDLGGTTMAQDELSCVIFGMPKCAIATGKVDHVLPAHEIIEKLTALFGRIE